MVKKKINKKQKKEKEKDYGVDEPRLLSADYVMALGSLNVTKKGILVQFDKKYLQRAIDIIKVMQKDLVTFYIETDYPLCIGDYDKKKEKIAGVIIAPRVEED